MNILLTNDDGYNSIGIRLIREKLLKYGNVYIVAPKNGMSAKSVSITIGKPLNIIEEEKDIYSVNGTPADCVSLGIEYFKVERDIKFDLIVSGCNNGLNISYDCIYSGTIGAALEGVMFRIKSIAISCDTDNFLVVEKYFDLMWNFIVSNNLISNEYVLNINFPKNEVQGVKLAKEYYRYDRNYFVKENDGYFAYRYEDELKDISEDDDCYLVEHGIISVCPLSRTYFNETLYNKLKI